MGSKNHVSKWKFGVVASYFAILFPCKVAIERGTVFFAY